MDALARRAVDGALLKLIRQWLDCGIMEGGTLSHPERGTPQGSPLSPLLANIYLDRMDKAWKASGLTTRRNADFHLVRYADDSVILGKAAGDVTEAKATLDAIMADLGLTLSPEKTRVVEAEEGFDFLGFHFVRHYSKRRGKRVTRWFPSAKSEQRFRDRIRSLTERRVLGWETVETVQKAVEEVVRGWAEYARHSMAEETFRSLGKYVQGRLGRLYRGARNKPGVGRGRDLTKVGLRLPTWPKLTAYGGDLRTRMMPSGEYRR